MVQEHWLQLTIKFLLGYSMKIVIQWGNQPFVRGGKWMFGANQHRSQSIKKIEKIQEKAIRIFSLKYSTKAANPLFKKLEIVKMKNIPTYNNCPFVHNWINEKLLNIL